MPVQVLFWHILLTGRLVSEFSTTSAHTNEQIFSPSEPWQDYFRAGEEFVSFYSSTVGNHMG